MTTRTTPATTSRGASEVAAWLAALGLHPSKPRWHVGIALDAAGAPASVYSSSTDTVFRLTVTPGEWSVVAGAPGRFSEVRVGTEPFVHGHDALGLCQRMPPLVEVRTLLREVERELGVTFPRTPFVRTNLAGAKKALAGWVASL